MFSFLKTVNTIIKDFIIIVEGKLLEIADTFQNSTIDIKKSMFKHLRFLKIPLKL